MLEHASLHPVVSFEGGADGLWRGSGCEDGAADEDRERRVGYVGCGRGKVICFGP